MSQIESVLHETRLFAPSESFVRAANVSGRAGYDALVAEAEKDRVGFWKKLAESEIQWMKPVFGCPRRRQRPASQMVCGRRAQHFRQLPGPPSARPRQSARHSV